MNDQKFDEKFEKEEEKEEKERDKHEEKTIEEKWHRDPLGTILWAVILIWAGLVFLADSLNLWENLSLPGKTAEGGFGLVPAAAFSIVLFGAGVILLIGVLIRLAVPSYRQPIGGTLFLAILFIGISLGNMFDWRFVGAFIIIALGVSILLRGLLRKKE